MIRKVLLAVKKDLKISLLSRVDIYIFSKRISKEDNAVLLLLETQLIYHVTAVCGFNFQGGHLSVQGDCFSWTDHVCIQVAEEESGERACPFLVRKFPRNHIEDGPLYLSLWPILWPHLASKEAGKCLSAFARGLAKTQDLETKEEWKNSYWEVKKKKFILLVPPNMWGFSLMLIKFLKPAGCPAI